VRAGSRPAQPAPRPSETGTRAFLDTNVLVYAYDGSVPAKQQRARALIQGLAGDDRILMSTQVLQEFYVVATGKLRPPVPEGAAEEAVRSLSMLPVVPVTPDLVLDGIRRSRADTMSLWDALIVEAALAGGADILYSEDLQDGRWYGDLRVVDPFADLGRSEG